MLLLWDYQSTRIHATATGVSVYKKIYYCYGIISLQENMLLLREYQSTRKYATVMGVSFYHEGFRNKQECYRWFEKRDI